MKKIKNIVIASDLREQNQEAILSIRLLHSSFVRHNTKIILLLSIVLFSFSALAQENNKKKVLVIPYGQFDMAIDFDLETIAKKNEITVGEVFFNYQKTLLNAFEATEDENFEFIALKHNTITPYKRFIKLESNKFNGKRYNSANLNEFKTEDFTKLLGMHGADFIVFVTWYEIKKEAHIVMQEDRKRMVYSGHYFDYDLFNLFKQRVIGEGRVKAIAPNPTIEQAKFALLRTTELEGAYKNFATHIAEKLNEPIAIDQ